MTENSSTLTLSVIVPARNEERGLRACLASLVAQSERGFALGEQWELLVVDDESTDGTAAIAAECARDRAGVAVMRPPMLGAEGAGFTGKNNACWAAAQIAKGRWLLFTDADTVHEPGDLSRALHEAERHEAALLSYSPRQVVTGFWQRVVMPLVFSELASVYPPKQVSDQCPVGNAVYARSSSSMACNRSATADAYGANWSTTARSWVRVASASGWANTVRINAAITCRGGAGRRRASCCASRGSGNVARRRLGSSGGSPPPARRARPRPPT